MTEGKDAGLGPPEPVQPKSVELREIDPQFPDDVKRYLEIDQLLDQEKWEPTGLENENDAQAEIREYSVSIPFQRKRPEPEFYLFGIGEQVEVGRGKLLGFVTTYDDEYIEQVCEENEQLASTVENKEVFEVAYAGHPEATEDQIVQGLQFAVQEILGEHARRSGDEQGVVVTTYWPEEDVKEQRIAEKAGFEFKGTYDLSEDDEADLQKVYVFNPQIFAQAAA